MLLKIRMDYSPPYSKPPLIDKWSKYLTAAVADNENSVVLTKVAMENSILQYDKWKQV